MEITRHLDWWSQHCSKFHTIQSSSAISRLAKDYPILYQLRILCCPFQKTTQAIKRPAPAPSQFTQDHFRMGGPDCRTRAMTRPAQQQDSENVQYGHFWSTPVPASSCPTGDHEPPGSSQPFLLNRFVTTSEKEDIHMSNAVCVHSNGGEGSKQHQRPPISAAVDTFENNLKQGQFWRAWGQLQLLHYVLYLPQKLYRQDQVNWGCLRHTFLQ